MVHVEAVLGAALPAAGSSAPRLLHEAELALQAAAEQPEPALVTFSTDLEATLERRRKLDIALRSAVERNELVVVFQPQVQTSDGELVGEEALPLGQSRRSERAGHADCGEDNPAYFLCTT